MADKDSKHDSTVPILRNDKIFKRIFKKNVNKLVYLICIEVIIFVF